MNKLKSIALLGVASLFLAPTFQSCKKGEDDPGLSLSSRSARLAGEWNMVSMEYTTDGENTYHNDPGINGELISRTYTTTTSYDGTTLSIENSGTENYDDNDTRSYNTSATITGNSRTWTDSETVNGTTTSSNGSSEGSYVQTIKVTIEKDGTFTWEESLTMSWVDTSSGFGYTRKVTETDTDVETKSGTWSWLGADKQNEIANKQRVAFWFADVSETETNDELEEYTDTDANDGFDWTTQNGQWVSEEVITSTYTSDEPDVIWNISMLKGKEMNVMFSASSDMSTEITTTVTAGGTSNTVKQSSSSSYSETGKMSFTQE